MPAKNEYYYIREVTDSEGRKRKIRVKSKTNFKKLTPKMWCKLGRENREILKEVRDINEDRQGFTSLGKDESKIKAEDEREKLELLAQSFDPTFDPTSDTVEFLNPEWVFDEDLTNSKNNS